jgi:Concanavalin A-like lectin/glucanases superfamily
MDVVSNTTALSKNFGSAVILLTLGVIVTFVVAYALYYWISSSIVDKQTYTFPDTNTPILGSEKHKLNADKAPFTANGQRKTLSFWIYLHDVSQFNNSMRHILHIGSEEVSPLLDGVSPIVYMNGSDTSMCIAFKPKTMPDGLTLTNGKRDENIVALTNTAGIKIKYIPIQRWVHVAVVVNETGKGGTITAYVDGELVEAKPVNAYNLNLDLGGPLITGGSPSTGMAGFSGLISRVSVSNFDMNALDVYNEYKKGPINNFFARLGLPAYGIQSPIYRIS